jgi:hypothetical protein
MPAPAATTISPGQEIKFSEYAVFSFVIIVYSLNQVSPAARKRVFLFLRNQIVQCNQAIIAKAIIECSGKKGFCSITQGNF